MIVQVPPQMTGLVTTARRDDMAPRSPQRPRIRRRLALIAATATGTVMLAFCIPLAFFVRNVAYDRAIDDAEVGAHALAAELASVSSTASVARLVRQANTGSITPVTVFLPNGTRIGAPLHGSIRVPAAVLAEHSATMTAPDGGRLIWEPVHDKRAATAVAARVPPQLLARGVAKTWALLFGGGALLVLIAVGLADRLGRFIVKPLLDLVTVTHRLRDGDLDSRSEPSGPYEVAEVGQAVNELAERINGLLANARLAAADLGHRLRTPLTALRLHVDAAGDPAASEQLRQDVALLEEAVNQLIRQTRDTPSRAAAAHADLAEAVRERMAYWSVLARSQHRKANVHVPDHRVDLGIGRDELAAAIDALLSNVFIHTPEGTGFEVALRPCDRESGSWSLLVENAGTPPGQADGRQPTMAQPTAQRTHAPALSRRDPPSHTRRQANGRDGTGLGLDIVRRTAAKVGGSVQAGATSAGGFRVEVRFPE